MKRKILFNPAVLLAASALVAQGAPKDDVVQAAKKLAQAGGYTWKATTAMGNFGDRVTEGKIGGDGIALVSIPRRDNTMQAAFKGDKIAAETDEGWQSLSELEQGGDQQGPGRFLVFMLRRLKAPAAEAEGILKHVESVTMADGACSGSLSEAGVKEMLSFRGRGGQGPEISNAKGSAKFWIKDDVLVKYEYTVQGTMSFGGRDRDMDRTTTVEISNVGSTKVDVPEAAKRKLS